MSGVPELVAVSDVEAELARFGLAARVGRARDPGQGLVTVTVTTWAPGRSRRCRGVVFRHLAHWASGRGLVLVNASPRARWVGYGWAADLVVRPGQPRPAAELGRNLLGRADSAVRAVTMATAFRDGPLDKVLAGSTLTAVMESVREDLLAVEQLRRAAGDAARSGALRGWPAFRARATGKAPGEREAVARITARVTALERYAGAVLSADSAYREWQGRDAHRHALEQARQKVASRMEAHAVWAAGVSELAGDAEAVRRVYRELR